MSARIEVDVTAAPLLNLIYFVAVHEFALWPIVLQNDFGPRSEENFFQIKAE